MDEISTSDRPYRRVVGVYLDLILPDPDSRPREGAIEWLNELWDVCDIVLLTPQRGAASGLAITQALFDEGFTGECGVEPIFPVDVLLSPVTWRFTGRFPSVRAVRYMTAWHPGAKPRRTAREHVLEINQRLAALERKLADRKRAAREAEERAEAIHTALHHALTATSCQFCQEGG